MNEISPTELQQRISQNEEIQVVDVREPYEREICQIQSDHIPMAEVLNSLDRIRRDIPVVVHCRSGQRSAAVISTLESKHGYTNLINLRGGILAYAQEVDPSLEVY